MEQQAKLAETLLEESEALSRQHNAQSTEAEALQRQVAELTHRLAAQVGSVHHAAQLTRMSLGNAWASSAPDCMSDWSASELRTTPSSATR